MNRVVLYRKDFTLKYWVHLLEQYDLPSDTVIITLDAQVIASETKNEYNQWACQPLIRSDKMIWGDNENRMTCPNCGTENAAFMYTDEDKCLRWWECGECAWISDGDEQSYN